MARSSNVMLGISAQCISGGRPTSGGGVSWSLGLFARTALGLRRPAGQASRPEVRDGSNPLTPGKNNLGQAKIVFWWECVCA